MRTLVCFALPLLLSATAVAQFPVYDGATKAVVVVQKAPLPDTSSAASELAAYLKRSTGADFRLVSEMDYDADRADARPIYVGLCRPVKRALGAELHRLDRDGYLVAVEPARIMLVGPTPWATYWAVCQFLEDYVGVRWLIPGNLGEDVPTHERILVPCGLRRFQPVILSRLWSGAQYGGKWSLRQRIHARYQFHHNLLRVFPPELFDQHPEYFPVHNGQRYRPGPDDHSWQPCMTDPGGIEHAADVARAAFAADPLLESFSFGINDGHGYCECESCRAMDRPAGEWRGFSGERSYLYYSWLNRIAENLERDYPDRMLGCLAYSAVIMPPPGLKLYRNIIPYLTSNRADYFDRSFRRADLTMLSRWAAVADQMGIYDYAYGMGFAIPRIYNHLFQDALQQAVARKVKGFYAEVYPNWGLDGPKLYVMARLLWDPQVDVDALSDEWNERMFREAAEPMKRYFARCERAWAEQKTSPGHWAYRLAADPRQFEIFTPAIIAECTGYLDQAAALAQSELVQARVRFFRKTWEVTALLAGNYWAGREVQRLVDEGAPVERVAAAMRQACEQLSDVDVDAYIAARVGDDPVAFHPPKPAWINPLKSGADASAKRWMVRHLASEAVAQARSEGALQAARIRDLIDARITAVFGTEGSDRYLRDVAQIRAIALKVGTVARLQAPVSVDGKLEEPVWAQTEALSDFTIWGRADPARHITRVRLAHDGRNLFIALECEQDTSHLVVNAAPRDGSTWKDDSVEIFINPRSTDNPWAQFIINAAGAFFDQYAEREDMSYAQRLEYNFDCQWAAQVREGVWTAEVRVPLGELGVKADEAAIVPVNFVRNVQGRDAEISSWFVSIRAHADALNRGWVVLQ